MDLQIADAIFANIAVSARALRIPPTPPPLQLGTFEVVIDFFPWWCGFLGLLFVFLEVQKQYNRFNSKGVANIFWLVQLQKKSFGTPAADEPEKRLMARMADAPIYSVVEFNNKVTLPSTGGDVFSTSFRTTK